MMMHIFQRKAIQELSPYSRIVEKEQL